MDNYAAQVNELIDVLNDTLADSLSTAVSNNFRAEIVTNLEAFLVSFNLRMAQDMLNVELIRERLAELN